MLMLAIALGLGGMILTMYGYMWGLLLIIVGVAAAGWEFRNNDDLRERWG